MTTKGNDKFRLIFHIGAGKTGTSSIQESLRQAKGELNKNGVDYWGLMLEHAPVKKYDWQNPRNVKKFLDIDKEKLKIEIKDVLKCSSEYVKGSGIVSAVWSNEFFFGKHELLCDVFLSLLNEGFDVVVISYVRSYEDWVVSAYKQWGIKDKGYQGRLKSFSEFFNGRGVGFYHDLSCWLDQLPGKIKVRNYDSTSNVIEDFFSCAELPIEGVNFETRSNESISNIELFMRAIFNDSRDGAVKGYRFDQMLYNDKNNEKYNKEWFLSLFPNEDDVREISSRCEKDKALLNEVLSACA